MNPQERLEFQKMKQDLAKLQRLEDISFTENLKRRISIPRRLSDLEDVLDTDNASTGEVLKKTARGWEPGTDNTA